MVCLLAALWVQLSVSAGNGWPHNALRYHWLMPISCHFRDCKALLVTSLTHVSGAIASVQNFTFTFIINTHARVLLARTSATGGGEWGVQYTAKNTAERYAYGGVLANKCCNLKQFNMSIESARRYLGLRFNCDSKGLPIEGSMEDAHRIGE